MILQSPPKKLDLNFADTTSPDNDYVNFSSFCDASLLDDGGHSSSSLACMMTMTLRVLVCIMIHSSSDMMTMTLYILVCLMIQSSSGLTCMMMMTLYNVLVCLLGLTCTITMIVCLMIQSSSGLTGVMVMTL